MAVPIEDREALVAHLTLAGWAPIEGNFVTLQCGTTRVQVVNGSNGAVAVVYDMPLWGWDGAAHDWDRVSDAHLRIMAEAIMKQEAAPCAPKK